MFLKTSTFEMTIDIIFESTIDSNDVFVTLTNKTITT